MAQLSDLATGRDNNFNLIRVLAALAVLFTHSFALSIGSGDAEPLRLSYGMTFGDIAVDVFFITSGFLVTASLLNRKNVLEFATARILRIYPALLVMLFLTAVIAGPALSIIPVSYYFKSRFFTAYLIKNITLVTGVSFYLPGLFVYNPFRFMANGSIWTLHYELLMYAALAFLWMALKPLKEKRYTAFKFLVIAVFLTSALYIVINYFTSLPAGFDLDDLHNYHPLAGLAYMFFLGGTFYVLKEKVVLSGRLFILLSVLMAGAFFLGNWHVLFLVFMLFLAYMLFYLAYIPKGFIRSYNKVGDYSYGIYIYAFFIEQTLVSLFPGITEIQLLGAALLVTLPVAIASWHFIEKKALRLKSAGVFYARGILNTTKPVS